MIEIAMILMTVFLGLLFFFCLYRAYVGPTSADRVVGINMMATKVTILIILISFITEQTAFIDVALVYAMTGFIATICVSKYIEKRNLF